MLYLYIVLDKQPIPEKRHFIYIFLNYLSPYKLNETMKSISTLIAFLFFVMIILCALKKGHDNYYAKTLRKFANSC